VRPPASGDLEGVHPSDANPDRTDASDSSLPHDKLRRRPEVFGNVLNLLRQLKARTMSAEARVTV
jgi:hypothetical protein